MGDGSSPSYGESLTSGSKAGLGGLMFIQFLVGIFGNSVILYMFWKFKQLQTPSNIIFISLLIANLGMCFCIPFSAASMLAGSWLFDSAGCKFYGFASMFFGLAVIGLLACLSIDRYIVICRPSLASSLTHSHYTYMSMAAYLNAVFWAIMPIFGWAHYDEVGTSGCSVDWTRADAPYISYLFSLFMVCFVLPIVTMVFCFGRTHTVLVMRQQVQNIGSRDNLSPVNSDWANQKQVTQLGVVLIVIFILTWSPFAIVCLWGALGDPQSIPLWLATLAPFAAKCSQFLNPLMFVVLIKRFRDYAVVMLCCRTHVETIELTPSAAQDDRNEGEL
ncbi:visual pigment-like receptor peropsin [Patiria miniata]|uniref:G-protein coupled receptors family 1 profile domain-containing protein n=1 Tax=Patiria miniata TaxID=46514 RepID=A0A914ADM5_PATMI|nr:visual pigment-like receptor peropsin [Patiria miniata]XP_038062037.1 visual pigment-like receptor peropsin [Patiria miniata]XP_038062038.1 visual pigment-like receptor peropsin [Patiria miniata]